MPIATAKVNTLCPGLVQSMLDLYVVYLLDCWPYPTLSPPAVRPPVYSPPPPAGPPAQKVLMVNPSDLKTTVVGVMNTTDKKAYSCMWHRPCVNYVSSALGTTCCLAAAITLPYLCCTYVQATMQYCYAKNRL